jgi:hypothetical protein
MVGRVANRSTSARSVEACCFNQQERVSVRFNIANRVPKKRWLVLCPESFLGVARP